MKSKTQQKPSRKKAVAVPIERNCSCENILLSMGFTMMAINQFEHPVYGYLHFPSIPHVSDIARIIFEAGKQNKVNEIKSVLGIPKHIV